jgi:hypothetical protein
MKKADKDALTGDAGDISLYFSGETNAVAFSAVSRID